MTEEYSLYLWETIEGYRFVTVAKSEQWAREVCLRDITGGPLADPLKSALARQVLRPPFQRIPVGHGVTPVLCLYPKTPLAQPQHPEAS